tara:strand:- start:119 stop:760 length:642 start_codon:yes stop_codon:yes gene_type:complete
MIKRNFKGVWIPAKLYLDSTLTWTQKLLLLEVDSFARNDKDCFVSNEHLAAHLAISESGIEKCLRQLVSKGLLTRERRCVNNINRRILRLTTSLECGHTPHSTEGADLTGVSHTSTTTNTNTNTTTKKGKPSSLDEVFAYFKEIQMTHEEAQKFCDWYDSVGWKVKGGNSIKDWRACARQWKRRNNTHKNETRGFNKTNFDTNALNDYVNNGS